MHAFSPAFAICVCVCVEYIFAFAKPVSAVDTTAYRARLTDSIHPNTQTLLPFPVGNPVEPTGSPPTALQREPGKLATFGRASCWFLSETESASHHFGAHREGLDENYPPCDLRSQTVAILRLRQFFLSPIPNPVAARGASRRHRSRNRKRPCVARGFATDSSIRSILFATPFICASCVFCVFCVANRTRGHHSSRSFSVIESHRISRAIGCEDS